MSSIIHSNHHHILHNCKEEFNEKKNESLRIVASDGIIFCNRLLFVLWSKFWKTLLNPEESEDTVIIPDIKVENIRQMVMLLLSGKCDGYDREFETFFDTFLDLFSDIRGDISKINIKPVSKQSTSQKSNKDFFEVKDSNVCKYCLEYFSSKTAKDRHIQFFHEKMQIFPCETCTLTFKTKNGLNSHKKAKHGISNEVYICEICGQVYKNISSLLRHCKISKHSFPVEKESKTLPKGFSRCNICLKLVMKLDEHKEIYHDMKALSIIKNLTNEDETYECSMCDFKTNRNDTLLKHERLKHNTFNKQFAAIEKKMKKDGKWTCSICDKIFYSIEDSENHIVLKKCKELKCNVCDKVFKEKHNLKAHINTVHNTDSLQYFDCEFCNKKFKHKRNLAKHLRNCDKRTIGN